VSSGRLPACTKSPTRKMPLQRRIGVQRRIDGFWCPDGESLCRCKRANALIGYLLQGRMVRPSGSTGAYTLAAGETEPKHLGVKSLARMLKRPRIVCNAELCSATTGTRAANLSTSVSLRGVANESPRGIPYQQAVRVLLPKGATAIADSRRERQHNSAHPS